MNRPTARVSAFALSSLACGACVSAFAFAPGCSNEGGHPVASELQEQEHVQNKVSSELLSAVKTQSRTRVIVTVREPESLAAGDFARSLRIDEVRKNVLSRVGTSVHVTRSWKHVPGFAADLDRAGLDALAADPDVEHVRMAQ